MQNIREQLRKIGILISSISDLSECLYINLEVNFSKGSSCSAPMALSEVIKEKSKELEYNFNEFYDNIL